jgi:hypothetical protein
VSDTPPSVGLIAGQLRYLFEERPRLAEGTAEELAEQLNHEDRFARARKAYPGEPDEVVWPHVDEFEPRITAELVEQALQQVRPSEA